MRRSARTIGLASLLAAIAAATGAALAACGSSGSSPASDARPLTSHQPPESGHASRTLKLHHRGQPIVWLRRGAKVPLRSSPGGKVVDTLEPRTEFGSRTVLAVFRRRGRWAGVPTPLLPNGALGWVKLDPLKLRAGWTRYEIAVDLSQRLAQLRLGDRVVGAFTVTVGAPNSPTPAGRFAVTDTFRGNLNPAYGCCAVAITARQHDLPSGWLGGDRIAIHGTTGPLGAALSNGCVRARDEEVSLLVRRVAPGAPVVIRQ
jgi:hypothetical protein